MTTGQNQNSIKKSLVLPQVQYHPSIQDLSFQHRTPTKNTSPQTSTQGNGIKSKCNGQQTVESAALCDNSKSGPFHDGPNGKDEGMNAKKSGKENLVLPQVRYHPSIVNASTRNGSQEITNMSTLDITNAKTSTATDGNDDTTPETVTRNGTRRENTIALSTVCDNPSAKSEDEKTKDSASRNRNLPQARYHSSIKMPQDYAKKTIKKQETSQAKRDLKESESFHTSHPEGFDKNGLTSRDARRANVEDQGSTNNEMLPKDKTKVENSHLKATRRKASNPKVGGGPEVQGLDAETRAGSPNLGATGLDGATGQTQKVRKQKGKKIKNSKSALGQEFQTMNCKMFPEDADPNDMRLENLTLSSAGFDGEGPNSDGTKARRRKERNSTSAVHGEDASGGLCGLGPDLLELGSPLDQSQVKRVEALTRGQRTNSEWFRFRKNRITASVVHTVANCGFANGKTTTAPASCLRTITGEGPRVQTRAMSWGIEHEKEVVQRYQELKTAALGRPVSVLDCGLFLDRSRPWLAASPDGIVIDKRTGQWLHCLEVKCPFTHRERRVQQACTEDPRFCLEILDQHHGQAFSLRRSHPYFAQVQCQMAVTGLKTADFVVWTQRDLVLVEIRFDPEFWDQTVSRLDRFYSCALIPYLRGVCTGNSEPDRD